jgi:hypothetical protein
VHFITPAQLIKYIDRDQICQETLQNYPDVFSKSSSAALDSMREDSCIVDPSERSSLPQGEETPTGIADIEFAPAGGKGGSGGGSRSDFTGDGETAFCPDVDAFQSSAAGAGYEDNGGGADDRDRNFIEG